LIDAKRLRDAVDRTEIVNLIGKSIIARDSGLWESLAECYHSEAEFTTSWYRGKPSDFYAVAKEKLDTAKREGGEQKHFTSNHVIDINGDRAMSESDLILFMRRAVDGVELDFATWSRRLQLFARENGEWKIFRRWVIYEMDRMDPTDPALKSTDWYDPAAMAKYPPRLRHHMWRNDRIGSAPEPRICLRDTDEDRRARTDARTWLAGGAIETPPVSVPA
jgi:hypothetical protein